MNRGGCCNDGGVRCGRTDTSSHMEGARCYRPVTGMPSLRLRVLCGVLQHHAPEFSVMQEGTARTSSEGAICISRGQAFGKIPAEAVGVRKSVPGEGSLGSPYYSEAKQSGLSKIIIGKPTTWTLLYRIRLEFYQSYACRIPGIIRTPVFSASEMGSTVGCRGVNCIHERYGYTMCYT